MKIDQTTFLTEAIQTPSHDGVTAMRDLLVETLEETDYDPEIDEKGNVLATRGTTGSSGRHLVLNSHIDTVPPHVPYGRDGDIIRGRGACDAKGPLTALLGAFCSASIQGGRLTLAVTPDEETAQFGGAHLGAALPADGYIVGEPTAQNPCIGARGNFGGRVRISGESGHASDPNNAINPIEAIGMLIEAIKQYDDQCGPAEHELLGHSTLTPTRVETNGPLNQIPAECTVSFDRRTVPPERIGEFMRNLESFLKQRLPDEYGVEVSAAYPDSPHLEAFATDANSELVQIIADISGGDIRPFGAATEASYFAEKGPTVVFGPGVLSDKDGPVAHSEREYITVSSIQEATEVVRDTIELFL